MTTGTVYNHFKTKDEVLQRRGAARWPSTLCERITDSQAGVTDGAERMAIGGRRYVWLAEEAPPWALLLLDVAAAAPELLVHIRNTRWPTCGRREAEEVQGASEEVAMDVINGTGVHAMRSVALGLAPAGQRKRRPPGAARAGRAARGSGRSGAAAAAAAGLIRASRSPAGAFP